MLPLLSDNDVLLFAQGNHTRLYDILGAHLCQRGGVDGVRFAVWAPNASRVSVVGDFNQWRGSRNPMRLRGSCGIWELFVPKLSHGELYKYEISGLDGHKAVLKADPQGFTCELRPKTASVIYRLSGYQWNDSEWMEARLEQQSTKVPISVYEVHLGSWLRRADEKFLSYREIADKLVEYVLKMGFTHVEVMPVTEHPFDGSWGYQTLGFFAPTSRYGSPHDFMAFVDKLHSCGIGVILDWVPAHFPRDEHGLSLFDGTHLYEYADPRLGEHPEWGTLIFDYSCPVVVQFLLNSALFWIEKYHIDGLRVDAVSSMLYLDYLREDGDWLPNVQGGRENLEAVAFIRRLNDLVHEHHAGVLTIAEESTTWPMVTGPLSAGGLGFDLKWNLGWTYDTLESFGREIKHRNSNYEQFNFSLSNAFSESFMLPLSHDEVVRGKGSILDRMPGDIWQQLANLRLLFAYMFTHPGKKLIFMGNEMGQMHEWDFDAALDWELVSINPHRQIQGLVYDLNQLYINHPALYELDADPRGFEQVCSRDVVQGVTVFYRCACDHTDILLVVLNFRPTSLENYRIGTSSNCSYREILNTDAAIYGGSNLVNHGFVTTSDIAWAGYRQSLEITVPPLGAVILKPASDLC